MKQDTFFTPQNSQMYRQNCLSHPGVELCSSKDWYVSNIILYWKEKGDSLEGSMLPKLPIISKIVQVKVIKNWISCKIVRGHTCLSLLGVELWGSKDYHLWNIIMYRNGKADSLEGSTLPKLPIISKNCSSKSYWELNFVQKSRCADMPPPPQEWSYRARKIGIF